MIPSSLLKVLRFAFHYLFELRKELAEHRKGILPLLPLVLFIVIVYPITVSKLIPLETFIIGDIELWPTTGTHFQLFLSSWYDTGEGGSGRVYSPFVLVKGLFVVAFGQLAAGKAFLLFLIPAAMISMFFASKIIFSSLIARYLASFVYAINPITLGEFYSASPLLAFYAILPLVVYTFAKLLEARNVSIRTVFAFSVVASASIMILVDSIIIMPILLSVIIVSYYISRQSLSWVQLRNIASSVGLTSILILPILVGYYQPASELSLTIEERGISNPIADVIFTYSNTHLLNLVKLAGNEGTGMSQLGYNNVLNWWNITGLIIPIIAFSAFAYRKLNIHRPYLVIAAGITIVLLLIFIWATERNLTLSIFENIAVLYTFRNPRKLMFLLSFSFAILFAIGGSQLLDKIRSLPRPKYMKVAFVAIIAVVLLVYDWPLFTGDLGISHSRNFPDNYQIPERYFEISSEIHNRIRPGERTIWLPMDLLPQYAISGLDENIFLLKSGSGLRGNIPDYYTDLYDALISQQTDEWGIWLSVANVKYVVVDKESPQLGAPSLSYRWDTIYATGNSRDYYSLLNRQNDLRLIVDNNEFSIFQNMRITSEVLFFDTAALPSLRDGDVEEAFDHVISPSPLQWSKDGETRYSVRGEASREVVMVVLTNYDPLWTSENEQIVEHFKAFNWANGFIVKPGDIDGSVKYSFQDTYAATATVAYASWIIVILLLINMHKRIKILPAFLSRLSKD